MAEIVLFIKRHETQQPDFEDGDILCAFTDNRIKYVHATHICKAAGQGFNTDGLRISGTLLEKFLSKRHKYKMERISKTEVRRTDLESLEEEILSSVANENGEAINVDRYLARRKSHERHVIFGSSGAEYWFAVHRPVDEPAVNAIWDDIESNSANLRETHTLWPLTEHEKKQFLGVKTDSFNEAEAAEFVSQEIIFDEEEGKDVVIKQRKRFVNWKEIILDSKIVTAPKQNEIIDKSVTVELRTKIDFVKSNIIEVKA